MGQTRCHDGSQLEECVTVEADGALCLQWVFGETCTPGSECSESGGAAQCVATCTDECTEGETRCTSDGLGVQTCVVYTSGCTRWVDPVTCTPPATCMETGEGTAACGSCDGCTAGALRCSDSALTVERCEAFGECTQWTADESCALDEICAGGGTEPPACVACLACTAGDMRCSENRDGIEACRTDTHGCTRFEPDQPCDPGLLLACDDADGTPGCTLQGDSCPAPFPIALPFHLELPDMTGFTSTIDYNHYLCGYNGYSKPDFYLSAWLLAGQRIHFYETGTADAGLAISQNCRNDSCLANEDDTQDLVYDVTADGTYIFIFEETSGAGTVSLHIEEVPSICTANESEPNNSVGEADTFTGVPDYYCHFLTSGTDQDCVELTIPVGGGSLLAETGSAYGMTTCPGDTYLELISDNGVTLFSDDNDGTGNCSLMDPSADAEVRYLTEGTYSLCIRPTYSYQGISGRIATHVRVDAPGFTQALFEDFEGTTFPPAGWEALSSGTATTSGWVSDDQAGNHRAQVQTASSDTGVTFTLRTASADLSGATGAVLQFITDNACGYSNSTTIYYSTDDFNTATSLWTDSYSTDPLRQMQLAIPAIVLGQPNVRFAFVVTDNYNYGECRWSVDDILIAVW